jgi:hypothetical protein
MSGDRRLNDKELTLWTRFKKNHVNHKCHTICSENSGIGRNVYARCVTCDVKKDITDYSRWQNES